MLVEVNKGKRVVARYVTIVVVVLACGPASWGIINPRFTPRHLAEQSDTIFAGPVRAASDPGGQRPKDRPGAAGRWVMTNARQLKGSAPAEHVVDLAACDQDQRPQVLAALKSAGKAPAILLSGTFNEEKRAFLHLAGGRLAKGAPGPITASCWRGRECQVCLGAAAVGAHSPGTYLSARYPGACTIRYRPAGSTPQTKTVTVEDGTVEVTLDRKADTSRPR